MFHVFPIKTIFSKLTVPKTMRIKVLAKLKFCVQIWTFHALEIKIILVILPLTPLPMGVAKPEFCAFVDIKCNFQEIIFSELGSNFTCLRQIPYHSWESQFSIPFHIAAEKNHVFQLPSTNGKYCFLEIE